MKLSKGNILFFGILALILLLALCVLVKEWIVPGVLAVLSVFGYIAKKSGDPVKPKTREKEQQAQATIQEVKHQAAENKETKANLDDRFNKIKNGLLALLFILICGGATNADLFIPKDPATFEKYYREAIAVAQGYKELSEKQAKQITDLTKAAEDLQTTNKEKDQIIADLQNKVNRANNRWGPTIGLDSDRGWILGISQKKDFWGWNLSASPNGSFSGSVTWWMPNL